jgi:hypothetical protein
MRRKIVQVSRLKCLSEQPHCRQADTGTVHCLLQFRDGFPKFLVGGQCNSQVHSPLQIGRVCRDLLAQLSQFVIGGHDEFTGDIEPQLTPLVGGLLVGGCQGFGGRLILTVSFFGRILWR